MTKISCKYHRTIHGHLKHNPRRPRNWKPVRGVKDAWENTKTFSGVSLEKLGGEYYVEERYINQLFNKERRKILKKGFDTKEKARKFAFTYMRSNSDFK